MYADKTDKTKLFTRGGQITFHNIRMFLQINKTVLNLYFFTLLALISLSIYMITPQRVIMSVWCCGLSKIYPLCELLNIKLHAVAIPVFGKYYYILPRLFPRLPYFVKSAHEISNYAMLGTFMGVFLSLGPLYGLIRWLQSRGEKQSKGRFIRGSRFDSKEQVAKLIKKSEVASDITIDGFPLIKDSETKHFLVHGTTGIGKSQLIAKILDCICKRGDRAIIYDKVGYSAYFYREGKDCLLNPFDSRSENWDLWSEARTIPDFENMAESLIPMHGEHDPYWVNGARTVFGSAAFTMKDNENRSIKELLKLLLAAELPALKQYLSDTYAASLASEKIEKTAISIRSVIATNLKSLRFLENPKKENKPKFCIKDWIAKEGDRGWLFLTSTDEQHTALMPLISMWFSMATIALLSLPASYERRLWFICDELPTLHRQPKLASALAQARKYGGCFVLGMQSISQLDDTYGRSASKAIYDLLNTAFYFRSPTANIAELVSRDLGSQEIEDMRENYSYGANTIRDGISIGAQRITTPVVFISEIMTLKDLHCYLKLPGPYPITLLNLMLDRRQPIANPFLTGEPVTDKEIKSLIGLYDTNDKGFAIKEIKEINESPENAKTPNEVTKPQENVENKDNDQNTNKLGNVNTANKADPASLATSILNPGLNHQMLQDEVPSDTDNLISELKKELSGTEFDLFSTLYELTKSDLAKGIELSRNQLSEMLGISTRSISRSTSVLCAKGLIDIEFTLRGDGNHTNIYKINISKVKAA